MDLRYDLKSGVETFAGAAVAGAARNILTSHPANPVPRANWYLDAGTVLGGLLVEGLGVMTNSRALHELGEGVLAPGFAYATADVTQTIRQALANKAASTPSGGTGAAAGYTFAPPPAYSGALSDSGF